ELAEFCDDFRVLLGRWLGKIDEEAAAPSRTADLGRASGRDVPREGESLFHFGRADPRGESPARFPLRSDRRSRGFPITLQKRIPQIMRGLRDRLEFSA